MNQSTELFALKTGNTAEKSTASLAGLSAGRHHTAPDSVCYLRGSIMTNFRPPTTLQPATSPSPADFEFEFVVIGGGFAGSLIATILQTQGRRVAIVDRSSHPRFAIGESSTPAASLILSSLADQYDLPWLKPFAKYCTWKAAYADITTGRKRGFSYFHHEPGKPFLPRADHSNELLAAASSSDKLSDTQWLRSDVDAFFFKNACESGVAAFENSEITTLHRSQTGWLVEFKEATQLDIRHRKFSAKFLIDASGAGQVLTRHLGIEDRSDHLATNSRAIFAHVTDLPEWQGILERAAPGSTADHPFHCDHAAQHHILDEGWMWWLRFDSKVTSVGVVLDERANKKVKLSDTKTEFRKIMNRYPSLKTAFATASFTNTSWMPIRTKRLQRLAAQIAGNGWAMLPHTAGFIDPLHSTGIAHSLAGVERLAAILLARKPATGNEPPDPMLQLYAYTIKEELTLIDQLVAGCYDAIAERSFRKFADFTMCYFAAATTWEHRRINNESSPTPENVSHLTPHRPALLCADVPDFRAAVLNLRDRLSHETDESFEKLCKETLAPFNHVGLFEPPVPNMYGATAVPERLEHPTSNNEHSTSQ
jgi:tetracycline 7-halogenase / FADH2 O2-dependent halogenase